MTVDQEKQLASTTMSTKVDAHRVRFYEPDNLLLYHCMDFNESSNKLAVLKKYCSLKPSQRVIASDVIELLDCKTDHFPVVFQRIHENENEPHNLECVVWGPNNYLFSAGMTGSVNQYDKTRNVIAKSFKVGGGPIWSLSYQRKVKKLAVATETGYLKVYSWQSESKSFDFGSTVGKWENRLLCVSWLNEDTVITGSIGHIAIWNVPKSMCLEKLLVGQGIIVWTVATFNERIIISGDSSGHTSFWDATDRCKITSVKSHEKDVLTVAVSKNGNVASSGVDQLMVLFDLNQNIPAKTVHYKLHTHDVRCMTYGINDVLFSGGSDSFLGVTKLNVKFLKKSSRLHFPHLERNIQVHDRQLMFQLKKSVEIFSIQEQAPVKTEEVTSKYNILAATFNNSWLVYSTRRALIILARKAMDNGDHVLTKVPHDFTESPLSIDSMVLVDNSKLAVACDKFFFFISLRSTVAKCLNPLKFEKRIEKITVNPAGDVLVTLVNRDVFHYSPSDASFSNLCTLPNRMIDCIHDPLERNIFWYLMSDLTIMKVNIESQETNTITIDTSSDDILKCRRILSTSETILIYSDERIFTFSASDGSFRNCISEFQHIVSLGVAQVNCNGDISLVVIELPPEILFSLLPSSYERIAGTVK